MEDDQSSPNLYKIHPTGQDGKFSDTALTNLFNTHVTILLHEERLVWQRYGILIVVNTIIVGFLSRTPRPNRLETVIASLLGILLCILWFVLTTSGWQYCQRWTELTQKFSWQDMPTHLNPYAQISPPYTFFLLNGDMELNRDRQLCV